MMINNKLSSGHPSTAQINENIEKHLRSCTHNYFSRSDL